ncbi:hypothetical protein BIW11_06874 [Tropilaelaps mercedesae]|uniref:Uncharacterized protein n=1 Tax=Tropilaelaps mercedesae TaxID=418985 RepID=A0A1V9XW65_9ACAR|nr:hypothetical protein BIW11_06874 [Tropilaelaps mercedesae]
MATTSLPKLALSKQVSENTVCDASSEAHIEHPEVVKLRIRVNDEKFLKRYEKKLADSGAETEFLSEDDDKYGLRRIRHHHVSKHRRKIDPTLVGTWKGRYMYWSGRISSKSVAAVHCADGSLERTSHEWAENAPEVVNIHRRPTLTDAVGDQGQGDKLDCTESSYEGSRGPENFPAEPSTKGKSKRNPQEMQILEKGSMVNTITRTSTKTPRKYSAVGEMSTRTKPLTIKMVPTDKSQMIKLTRRKLEDPNQQDHTETLEKAEQLKSNLSVSTLPSRLCSRYSSPHQIERKQIQTPLSSENNSNGVSNNESRNRQKIFTRSLSTSKADSKRSKRRPLDDISQIISTEQANSSEDRNARGKRRSSRLHLQNNEDSTLSLLSTTGEYTLWDAEEPSAHLKSPMASSANFPKSIYPLRKHKKGSSLSGLGPHESYGYLHNEPTSTKITTPSQQLKSYSNASRSSSSIPARRPSSRGRETGSMIDWPSTSTDRQLPSSSSSSHDEPIVPKGLKRFKEVMTSEEHTDSGKFRKISSPRNAEKSHWQERKGFRKPINMHRSARGPTNSLRDEQAPNKSLKSSRRSIINSETDSRHSKSLLLPDLSTMFQKRTKEGGTKHPRRLESTHTTSNTEMSYGRHSSKKFRLGPNKISTNSQSIPNSRSTKSSLSAPPNRSDASRVDNVLKSPKSIEGGTGCPNPRDNLDSYSDTAGVRITGSEAPNIERSSKKDFEVGNIYENSYESGSLSPQGRLIPTTNPQANTACQCALRGKQSCSLLHAQVRVWWVILLFILLVIFHAKLLYRTQELISARRVRRWYEL